MSAMVTLQSPRASSPGSNNALQSNGSSSLNNLQENFDGQRNSSNSPSKHDSTSATSLETSGSSLSGPSTGGVAEDEEDAEKSAETDNISSQVVTLPITPVKIIQENSVDVSQVEQNADDIFDLDFDKEEISDSDADESPDAELDIAEDDDDYDAVDRLSDTSEHSAHMEGDAEDDIFAEAELGIDWNDEQTYGFVDSWENSQYSLAAELKLGDSLPEDTLLLLDQSRRMSASSKPPVEKTEEVPTYVSNISFPDEWSSSEDEDGSDNEKPILPDKDLTRRVSNDTSASGQTNADSISVDGDDETDEEDIGIGFQVVSSPAIAMTVGSPVTAQSSPFSRRVSPSFPKKANRKAPVMRKIPVDPKKAICSSVITPKGRVIQFNVPKKSYAIRWIMAGNSRSSSAASCPSKFGLRSTIDHSNSRTGSMIHDVINGRLFQQYHCSPLTVEDHSPSTDVVRNPFLGNSLRPMYLRTPSRRHGGFEELEVEFDEVHEGVLNLIDFDGGDADEDAASEEAADLALRSHRRHSAPAHSPNLLNQGEKLNVPLLDLDDTIEDAEVDGTLLNVPQVSKKRGYSNSSATSEVVSPLLKKQRLLKEAPVEAVA